jgi:hypothetical protein
VTAAAVRTSAASVICRASCNAEGVSEQKRRRSNDPGDDSGVRSGIELLRLLMNDDEYHRTLFVLLVGSIFCSQKQGLRLDEFGVTKRRIRVSTGTLRIVSNCCHINTVPCFGAHSINRRSSQKVKKGCVWLCETIMMMSNISNGFGLSFIP